MRTRYYRRYFVIVMAIVTVFSVLAGLGVQKAANAETASEEAGNPVVINPNEIQLSGRIVSIDAAQKSLVLKATSFTLPNGRTATLAQAKEKQISCDNATSIWPLETRDRKLWLSDLKVGDEAKVIGRDAGSGKELAGREIVILTLRLFAPQFVSATLPNGSLLRIKSTTPSMPASLNLGQNLDLKIQYNNAGDNAVNVFALPYAEGQMANGFRSSGSQSYPKGGGEVASSFSGQSPVLVDEVRVTMVDTKTRETLLTLKQPVHLSWDNPKYNPNYGQLPVKKSALANPEPDATNTGKKDSADSALDVKLVSFEAPAKLTASKGIILYANPGKNFKVDLTVKYKTPVPTKLAANLLLEKAKILPPEFTQQLGMHHSTTWHFDTETRLGYHSVEGDGEIKFNLIGYAPREEGKYTFDINVGLFDKKTWAAEVVRFYKVTLITDKRLFDETNTS